MNPIILAVIGVLAPFAAAFLATQALKANAWVNALPAPLPSLIGVALAFVFSLLTKLIPGVVIPETLGAFDQATIAAILVAVGELLFPVAAQMRAARLRAGLRQ